MQNNFKYVLLVDDDEASNFLHKRFLRKTGKVEEIQVAYNGLNALEILESRARKQEPLPDLIFLDLNMPVMTGWEFINAYKNAKYLKDQELSIYVLTSSLNPNDRIKAEQAKEINGIIEKLLTKDKFNQIVEEYFQH